MAEENGEQQIDVIRIKVTASGANKTASNLEKVAEALERINKVSNNQNNIKSTANALNELASSSSKVAKTVKDTGSKVEDTGDKTDEASEKIKKATKSSNNFFTSLKRIAMYRLIRSALSWIANSTKEGITNLYNFSKATNGTFAKSMDRISSASQFLKNSLATLFEGLIIGITPTLETLSASIGKIINGINYTIAKMTGAETWTKANWSLSKYKDTVDDTADSVNKLLGGIDEINTFGDSTSTSTVDYADMFETIKVSETDEETIKVALDIESFINEIKGVSVELSTAGGSLETAATSLEAIAEEIKVGNAVADLFTKGEAEINGFKITWSSFFEWLDFELRQLFLNIRNALKGGDDIVSYSEWKDKYLYSAMTEANVSRMTEGEAMGYYTEYYNYIDSGGKNKDYSFSLKEATILPTVSEEEAKTVKTRDGKGTSKEIKVRDGKGVIIKSGKTDESETGTGTDGDETKTGGGGIFSLIETLKKLITDPEDFIFGEQIDMEKAQKYYFAVADAKGELPVTRMFATMINNKDDENMQYAYFELLRKGVIGQYYGEAVENTVAQKLLDWVDNTGNVQQQGMTLNIYFDGKLNRTLDLTDYITNLNNQNGNVVIPIE